MRAGVAVVGGGIMGAVVASELARRADPLHAPVVLFEAGSLEPCAPATTFVETGADCDGALRAALTDGERLLASFETQVGRGIGFGRPGLLRLGVAPASEADQPRLRAPLRALGLDGQAAHTASWNPNAGLFQAASLHRELLALGRTRGLITRPGTRALALSRTPGAAGAFELETSQGPCEAQQVLIVDLEAARALTPELVGCLTWQLRTELLLPSPAFGPAAESVGSVQDLIEVGADPDSLDAFFGVGESLEYPFASVSRAGLELLPDPIAGGVLVAEPADAHSGAAPLEPRLADVAPAFAELGPSRSRRELQLQVSSDGLPVLGQVPGRPGLFLALGLGRREAQLAAGLGPSLAALMHAEPAWSFDAEQLAPSATRGRRS